MAPRDLALMIFICLVWGFTFVAGKWGVTEIPPLLFTALRYAMLTVVLLPFLRLKPGQMGRIALVSVTMGSLHFALFYGGLALSDNVSIVAIAVQLGVPFSTLLSIVILSERVGLWRWSGIALAFAGVMLIGFDPRVFDDLDGLLMVIGAAAVGAVGTVAMRRMQDIGVFQLQSWIAMLSWWPLLLVSLIFEESQLAAMAEATWRGWAGVLYTALGASLIGHAGMFYLLKRYEVSLTAPLTLLAPVFGVMFGITVWGDEFTLRMALGGAITLSGVLIIALRRKELVDTGP